MNQVTSGNCELEKLSRNVRRRVLRMIHGAKSSHIGSCFSIVELLAVLYGDTLRVKPEEPAWPDRDRFILSKGHACAALYAVLAESGFFPPEWLERFYQNGSRLAGHITHVGVPGVEVSTGALGHGLPIGCGMALAARRNGSSYRVFALLSDGECDEGSVWEAALFASQHGLDNLVVIVDYNKIQSLGAVKDVLDLEPFAEKWRSFGWATQEIDGHSISGIKAAFHSLPLEARRPTCFIAHTVKGKGITFMEDSLLWHYRAPNAEELGLALHQLDSES